MLLVNCISDQCEDVEVACGEKQNVVMENIQWMWMEKVEVRRNSNCREVGVDTCEVGEEKCTMKPDMIKIAVMHDET